MLSVPIRQQDSLGAVSRIVLLSDLDTGLRLHWNLAPLRRVGS
jgi:hypothetical protein